MRTLRLIAFAALCFTLALGASPGWAEQFSLPQSYWPQGFSWEEHHYSGWTGASLFRSGRTDPKEYPVLHFSTPGTSSEFRIGGITHDTEQAAIAFQANVTRKGPVAESVPDAHCQKNWSNENLDSRGLRWSSGLQFNCRIGRMTFYVDLRSLANSNPADRGALLNQAVTPAELHDVATAIVAGFRRYAKDRGLIGPTDRLSAALFPDPASERPSGYWWAKNAGAVYDLHGRPHPMPDAATPSWMQTIEVSRAPGLVFKPFGTDGSGAWCRPEKNGMCDLVFQRVDVGIMDFSVHGGQDTCLKSLAAPGGGARKTTRGDDPDQTGVRFCRDGFFVTIDTIGLGEAADTAVAEYYADVVAARIDGRGAPPGGATSGGTPTSDGRPVAGDGGEVPSDTADDTDARTGPSPEAIAAGAVAAGAVAGLGAWLMSGQAGIGRRETFEGLADLLAGRLPDDGFDAWKAKYEAMGWRYREENGVAVFDPPEGHGERPAPEVPRETHRDGDVDPRTGDVWSDEDRGWIGRNLYDQEKHRPDDVAAIEARDRRAVAEWDAETRRLDEAIANSQRDRAGRAAADEALRRRLGDKLTKLMEEKGVATEEVDRLRREADTAGLEDLYERTIRDRMIETAADAAHWRRWAMIHGAGELASRAVLAGAKAGMMAVTGPVGYIPAAIGSGILRSAEEGATAYVASGGSKAALGKALVSGLASGVKDGVVGRFTSLPRTGTATKILLPAGADAAETAVRTGDLRATVTTAVLSGTGGAVGHALDAVSGTMAREMGHAATGATLGGIGSHVAGGSFTEGAVDGLVESIGGRVGQHIGTKTTPMTRAEIRMDLEYADALKQGRERIDDLRKAIDGGDPTAVKKALHDVLDHREAKLIMGSKDVDPSLKQAYADLTREHRTRPVFDGTADALNTKTIAAADGSDQPRYVVRDADGNERAVKGTDFASGSGSGTKKPGMDLDMYPKETIVDKATGRPAGRADIDAAVGESCAKLGIDRDRQEINVTGGKGPEDWTMRPGETPEQFIARVQAERRVGTAEGAGVTEVATHKLAEATRLHGGGAGSSAVAEHARGVMKDHGRLLDHLLTGDGKAQVPEVFRRQLPGTSDTPLAIMKKVADGSMMPGEGNAAFRRLTGMNISDAAPKIASWAEALGRWHSEATPGAPMPHPPTFTGPGAGATLQQTVASVLGDVTGRDEHR